MLKIDKGTKSIIIDGDKTINFLENQNIKLYQQLLFAKEKISKALKKISERCDYIKEEYQDSFDCCIEELSEIEKTLESGE